MKKSIVGRRYGGRLSESQRGHDIERAFSPRQGREEHRYNVGRDGGAGVGWSWGEVGGLLDQVVAATTRRITT